MTTMPTSDAGAAESTGRRIGRRTVSALGLGAMPLSMGRGDAVSTATARDVVAAALDAGITLIDTADIYAPSFDTMGHNERTVADAVGHYTANRPGFDPSTLTIATKGGITRGDGETWGRDSSVGYLRTAVVKSKINLGVESIDLYYLHRPDRTRPYAEAIETLAVLQDEGHVENIGISNASIEEIEIALDVLGGGGTSPPCRTSSHPASTTPATRSSGSARNTASRSCRGHRSVAPEATRQSWANDSP